MNDAGLRFGLTPPMLVERRGWLSALRELRRRVRDLSDHEAAGLALCRPETVTEPVDVGDLLPLVSHLRTGAPGDSGP